MTFFDLNKRKYWSLILLSIFMTGCTAKKDLAIWSRAAFDANISKTPVYNQLDKQNELFSAFEKQDPLIKRTSDVEYSSGQTNNLKVNNCRAYYRQSDTLFIDIGISTGFSAQGFVIKYKGKQFYTKPYLFTDVITDEPEPTYEIVNQKLILDKSTYKTGDSFYGYIDFKSIETDENKHITEHWGRGYFRTRIARL